MNGRLCRARRGRDDRGAALVEFSLVFVLFVFIAYGLVAFGMALDMKQNLTHAAAEGARAAVGVGGGCDPADAACIQTAQETAARDRVQQALSGQGAKASHAQTAVAFEPCSSSGGSCIRVTITYPYEQHPIVPPAPGLGLVLPDVLKANATVKVGD